METKKKEYYWDEDTIFHFQFESKYLTKEETRVNVREFVEIDCQLEEGETEEDLATDLMSKIFPND